MNGDLISRSAVLDALKTEEGAALLGNSLVRYLKAKALFEEIPAVDAEMVFEQMGLVKEAFEMAKADLVPVVRCKDCKCGKHPDSTKLVGKYVNCALYDPMPLMRSNDFCSYGERRADE